MTKRKWKTGLGELMHVSEMKTDHLNNCVSKFDRKDLTNKYWNGVKIKTWLIRFRCELARRESQPIKLYQRILL